eukprot:7239367-Pyramimonas_sp.AAC.1
MSRATTPFGTRQSAGGNSSLQARLQSIRMDPQLYQALQATSPLHRRIHMRGKLLSLTNMPFGEVVGQQERMYRQMREAAQSIRRGGIDLP